MARKAKKSKSQIEYERARKNLGQYIRRMEKAGSIYYADLPVSPKKGKKRGEKVSAREYRQATKEIKRLWDELKGKRTRERELAGAGDEYSRMIQDWIGEITSMSTNRGRGVEQIADQVLKWLSSKAYTAKDIAGAIDGMTATGVVISWPVYYNPDAAAMFIASMEQYILQEEWASSWEMQEFEESLFDIENVDYELQ